MTNARVFAFPLVLAAVILGIVLLWATSDADAGTRTVCDEWQTVIYTADDERQITATVSGTSLEVKNDPGSISRGNIYANGVLLGAAPVEAQATSTFAINGDGIVISGGDDLVSVTVRGCAEVEVTTTTQETTTTWADTTTTSTENTTTTEVSETTTTTHFSSSSTTTTTSGGGVTTTSITDSTVPSSSTTTSAPTTTVAITPPPTAPQPDEPRSGTTLAPGEECPDGYHEDGAGGCFADREGG